MRRGNKVLISLVGIILIIFAIYQLGLLLAIPAISKWSKFINQYASQGLTIIMIVAVILVGLVGISLLIMGIFKPIRLKKFVFHYKVGTLEIPESVIEKNLSYQLVNQYGLINPDVKIKLYKHHRAKARITAVVNGKSNIPKLAEPINQTVEQYLKAQLDMQTVSTSTKLTLPDYKQKSRVV